ncbi:MAG: L-glutamate gamma-semialdehyde dehydrogenase [Polaromonas sp.]|uniref:L-glutamate gamma-semialdehyde dehydrogenase n=1 Tax=Polaromonas sp. TaxID=1869339 RepID=UPI0024881499|nr:L-glutamate gamma-semialdehyde dehydrogenase [Polaromonas sp.]MDI1269362.1 L-glutamate gamma-semialdehyde dehydrogenase [Polaromonas sp.]
MSQQARLPFPYRPEASIVSGHLQALAGALDWAAAAPLARPWVQAVRNNPPPFWAMESLLKEYPISSAEGLALMRLAEALMRVPDAETAIALTADQLGRADFDGASDAMMARLSASAIAMSKKFLPPSTSSGQAAEPGLMSKLGARTVVAATLRAVQLLGRQFVLGQNIGEAMKEADRSRKDIPGLRFSYDMLGEGARTEADALHYLTSYTHAIESIAARAGVERACEQNDGISIKLSALHPRYEDAQHARVLAELVPRVWGLCELAARANINLTIDAEEVDRLELSLDVFEALAALVAQQQPQWQGFGLALQAYQTRALDLIDHVIAMARQYRLRFMCRLVKGAYWDSEIKRAQELGLPHYPVFTHKHHTDVSYLACAQALLAAPDAIYPQFAGHNAGTIAAILQMAQAVRVEPFAGLRTGPVEPPAGEPSPQPSPKGRGSKTDTAWPPLPPGEGGGEGPAHPVPAQFELQRLHGMGEGVFREVLKTPQIACRVYAPVGAHRDLLAYLVRRLLENGANSSFVHQLADESVGMEQLLTSPLRVEPEASLPLPPALYGPGRPNSEGLDLTVEAMRAPLFAAFKTVQVPAVPEFDAKLASSAVTTGAASYQKWSKVAVAERAATLRRAADALQQQMPAFCALLVREAFKTWGDAVSEVREAIDFLRYYAGEAERIMAPIALPGPTGETNELRLTARGVWVCISPWNFPLAIFTGQVAAALATGNAVLAKPAEQTPGVAWEAVKLLHAAGVPEGALQLLHGPGDTVGAALVAAPGIAGVVFTGSTQVAKIINRALAAKDGPIVPLIAETGGINAMLVDSSALPEQVVDAVVQSAFRSAGQRCSALRLLCVHEGIADKVMEMIQGALQELAVGDPAQLSTDVGPVIDREAYDNIQNHLQRLGSTSKVLPALAGRAQAAPDSIANLVLPGAFEVASLAEVKDEIFGPVLQIVRWGSGALNTPEAVIAQINALGSSAAPGGATPGYGLTLGIQTRIDSRAQALAAAAHVGNIYINRNMIGAVVGSQPFGGEGLSGTGPKAGGPHYLYRFCAEQTVTVNTTAAGGNAALLSGT